MKKPWPFYYYYKGAGFRWNLGNFTLAFADWLYHKVYTPITEFGYRMNKGKET